MECPAISSIPEIGPWLPYLTALVTLASGLATFLPPPDVRATPAYRFLYGAVHWIALNKGQAKASNAL